jgi:hypothetical protein
MSDSSSNLIELTDAVNRVQKLLADPQPGLVTWTTFLQDGCKDLNKALLGAGLGPVDVPDQWAAAFAAGWKILPTSCGCGGNWAWLKPRMTGSFEMVGCVCHTNLSERRLQLEISA